MTTATATNTGKIVQVIGPVIDVEFASEQLPELYNAIEIKATTDAGQQIRVVGEAARPQFLPYKQDMTLLDVMIAVGGLTDFADGNKATILRTAEGNKQYSVRLRDLIKRGDVSANVQVRPGDILIIPQSLF